MALPDGTLPFSGGAMMGGDGSQVSRDDIFKLRMTRGGGGITAAVYDPLQSPDTEVDINETEDFDITQPGIYAQIVQSIADGRTPVITAGSSGNVRLYYYTSKDTQNGTVTFTCGYDGIVELLVLHSNDTYEFVTIPGEVSVLKGNCDSHSVIPGNSGPTDFDCHEVEKEGSDIWIGSDKRVHANAGWYHVDMGVHVEPVDLEHFVDGRATIYVGAYTGTVPSANFDYSNYTSVELDLSYNHKTTPAVGFDIQIENDGDVIHLSAGAPVGDYTAECLLEWFSIHRIKGAGSGGGGGDTPSGDCNVHVIDLQYLEDAGPALWEECISAILDGKLLAIRVNSGDAADNSGFVCWNEKSIIIPTGYTKDSYIEYLRSSMYSTLTFYGTQATAGTLLVDHIQFTIDPNVGLQFRWGCVSMTGVGIVLVGNGSTGEFGSQEIICIDYSDPDNPKTTIEPTVLIGALGDAQNRGIPLFLYCRNSTREFQIYGRALMTSFGVLRMKVHDIATYYEDPDDSIHSEQIPVDYYVQLQWHDDPDWTTTQGYYTIYTDAVYPLALDSRFGGPVQ